MPSIMEPKLWICLNRRTSSLVLSEWWGLFCDITCVFQFFDAFCFPGLCFDPSPSAQRISDFYLSTHLLQSGPDLSACWGLVWTLLSSFSCAFLSCLDILRLIWVPLSSSENCLLWLCVMVDSTLHAGGGCTCAVSRTAPIPGLNAASYPSLPGLLCFKPVHRSSASLALHWGLRLLVSLLWNEHESMSVLQKREDCEDISHGGLNLGFNFSCQNSQFY